MSYQGKAALAAILLTVGLVAVAQPVKTVDAPYVPKGAAPAKSAQDLPFASAAALPVDPLELVIKDVSVALAMRKSSLEPALSFLKFAHAKAKAAQTVLNFRIIGLLYDKA